MKEKIYEYLKQSHLPVKRSILLNHLITLGYEITDRKLRSTVEEMISHDFFLIESSELGYAIIQNETQLEKAKSYLSSKIEALCIRRNSLTRNWEKQKEKESATLLSESEIKVEKETHQITMF